MTETINVKETLRWRTAEGTEMITIHFSDCHSVDMPYDKYKNLGGATEEQLELCIDGIPI